MIRAVVADDQRSVRRAFTAFLHDTDDIRVVGESVDGPTAVSLAREHHADVVLMDVRMPGGDGITATERLAGPRVARPIPVVVITTFDLDEYLFGALEAGAVGFLLKDAPPPEIVAAVRAAASGDALVSPRVTRRVLTEFARRRPRRPDSTRGPELTPREHDVLAAIRRGLSNAEIAAELFIETGTVKTHVSNVIRKLGVRDRVQAIVWAFENDHLFASERKTS
ncbi:LuxR family two component transcriptional regulator [Stackebrandtia endophytica]|uniref:LuxR family two component transcriptional regulator n=1 Tax=Stackebrandtia endophytica TaxID=1496996 RepID=A0A543B094_9ACTN|nr:response regulator transcription factor [Stackebrandtia endophytica]TQL78239.1 LuxR family two component transcriptional regulator [Stackebrandtia endophytica]